MSVEPKVARCPIALGAVLIALLAASSASASDARYEGISAAGDVAFFSTTDKLVPGDTDNMRRDVYARAFDASVEGYVTRQVSLGPTGGNSAFDAQYIGVDELGDKVFFSTAERLTADDKDTTTDIYVRNLTENKTTLVSAGDPSCLATACGNANSPVAAVSGGIVAAGNRVFFASEERLSSADEDAAADVYMRDLQAGTPTTTLVSTGLGSQPATFLGASAAGTKAFFSTKEVLAVADDDSLPDIYQRDLGGGETTTLVSTPKTCPGAPTCTPVFEGASGDGSHVFFETSEQLDLQDSDESQDVYDWSGGTAALVSQGPVSGNGKFNALFAGSSANGDQVFFTTDEPLIGTDKDKVRDVYLRSGGSTELVSNGDASCQAINCGNGEFAAALRWVSSSGATAVLSTDEPLIATDQDAAFDVYARGLPGGSTTLVSRPDPSCVAPGCGNSADNANFAGASATGAHVFFVTEEQLSAADKDSSTDVYDRNGGTTTLVSSGSINGNGPFDAQLQGNSTDGTRAFLVTKERLTDEDDFAAEQDVYLHSESGTVLVSQGNDAKLEAKLAPPPPLLQRTSPESPGESTEPKVIGSEPEAAAAIKLYATDDCSGAPVATGTAEQLGEPGIAVAVAAGSLTTFRATAEAEGFTSTCSGPISYSQQGPEAPHQPPADGVGTSSGASLPSQSASPAPARTHNGIAYVVPLTRITFGPAFKTRARRPVFLFTDTTGQPGTHFICKLDRGGWKPCASPFKLPAVARGRHVFQVRGVNAVGAAEDNPVKRNFKLVPR